MLTLNLLKRVRIGRHFQIVKDQARRKTELPHFLRDIAYALAFEKADSESPQACHVLRTVTF